MGFWKKLFGGGGDETAAEAGAAGPTESYKDYTIRATLMSTGGEYQLAGTIEKEIGGELKRYQFIRADKFSSKEDATSATFGKGRQLIDEQGDGIFA
jgi:hypothetical protein